MAKAKIILSRIIVFFLVFAGAVIAISYFMNENPFDVPHDAGANIRVWLDSNGNGKKDNDEPFLPNVCVWAGYASSFQALGAWEEICKKQYFMTDFDGAWSEFFAGGSCPEIYNAINVPENYFPTTPTIVNGCSVEFGLAQEKPTFEIQSPDAGLYLQQESQGEITTFRVKTGIVVLLISVFAGFVSFKTIRLGKAKAG
jgi:hypothetical protein